MSLEPREKSVIDRCILRGMDYMKFAGIFRTKLRSLSDSEGS